MSADREPNEANFSGTVIKALNVLDCLAQHRRPMSTQEIARACGMSRPTTYRLLSTLLSRGFVRSDGDYNYSLGTKFLSLGKIVLDSIDLQELARPYLHELCQLSNETANLAILDDTELLYIGKEESLQNSLSPVFVQMRSTIGTRVMLHSTSMGKAILAHLAADQVQAILERTTPLKAYTAQTIIDPTALRRELDRVRERGYAIDDREVDDGTRCVAAPVFDSSGQVIAAMSVAGPAYRLTIEQLTQMALEVMRVAQALSQQLGYGG